MSKWSEQRKCVSHLNPIITYYIIITANSSLDGPQFGFPSPKSGGEDDLTKKLASPRARRPPAFLIMDLIATFASSVEPTSGLFCAHN